MTAPELMPDCPTEETLAAFVDNRLNPEQRRIVVAHLATHGACRELVMMTTELQTSGELAEEPAVAAENVVPIRFGQRWRAAAGVAAAAASVAFLMLWPSDMDKLVKASASLQVRPTAARFADEDFPYKPAKPTNRGVGDDEGSELGSNAGVYAVAGDSKDPHVLGVAYLLSGDKDWIPQAIPELRKAQAKADGDERDAVDLDLAAALLRQGGDEDLKEALSLSEGVWQRKHLPVAAWNRAVALGLLERKDQAKRAWNEYLALDSTSQWADEARTRLARLDDTF